MMGGQVEPGNEAANEMENGSWYRMYISAATDTLDTLSTPAPNRLKRPESSRNSNQKVQKSKRLTVTVIPYWHPSGGFRSGSRDT